MIQLHGNAGGTFILVGIVLTVLRITIVLLWAIVGHHSIGANIWIELGLTILSLSIVASIAGGVIMFFTRRLSQDFRYENIVSTATIYSVSTLALLLFAALVPGELQGATPLGWLTVFTSHLVAIGTYTISIGLAAFLTVVSLQRQHKRTRRYLIIQTLCVLSIWLSAMLLDVGSAFGVISIMLVLVGGIVSQLNIRRLNWLGTITLDKKIRLLWLCICGAFAAIVLTFMLTFGYESYMLQSTHMFLPNGTSLPIVPAVLNFYGFLFFVRMFFATLASLPNSGIVDRRSSEVQALSGLTKLVAQSASVEALLTSVTQYSLAVCRAHGAWCEMYDAGGLYVVGPQLVSADYVLQLHNEDYVHQAIVNTNGPLHIESLNELYNHGYNHSVVRSLIAIPLYEAGSRVGSIVMFSTVDYGFEQDDVSLLVALGDTISVGLEQARLRETSIENERLQREFEVARSIQISLLPRSSPVNVQWEVEAIMIPATQVGGDYYDFVEYGNGNSGVVIADVSGKGIPAALYMATLKGVVLAQASIASSPADLLSRINSTLHAAMDRRTYISMAAIELDMRRGIVCVARAGHTPVLIRTSTGVHTLCPRGAAIGLLAPAQFSAILTEECIPVQHGDMCLLTTDGVTERRNHQLAEISSEPLEVLLASNTTANASELVQKSLFLVEEHGAGTEAHDDITIVGIKVLGGREAIQADVYTPIVVGEEDDDL